MMEIETLTSASIRGLDQCRSIRRILSAALEAVEPGAAVRRCMERSGTDLRIGERHYDLGNFRSVRLAGAGKAGYPMTAAAADILGPHLTGGVVIIKENYGGDLNTSPAVEFIEAGHPIPDQRGVDGTQRMLKFLEDLRADDLVIFLISGGGSALLTAPAGEIGLDDLQELTEELLASGANIQQINTLRKHVDTVKGGGLARLIAPAALSTLILSDVPGDRLDVIASGPTVPDPTTFEQAYQILRQFGLIDRAPKNIIERLRQGMEGTDPETPKPGDPCFERVDHVIIGNNQQAASAALAAAKIEGYHGLILTTYLQGEARQAGMFLGSLIRQIAVHAEPAPRPACLIAGGETTVTLDVHNPGSGGRNQELALAAAGELAGLVDVLLVALATDGGDGPTDAAGAVVSGNTLERARLAGLDATLTLRRHDAYHFFDGLDDLIKTGPTQTNVNDLIFLFAL